jgi:hypothetical protein
MLLDSNVIIYAAKPEHGSLRRLIAEKSPAVSAISYVEVLTKLSSDSTRFSALICTPEELSALARANLKM